MNFSALKTQSQMIVVAYILGKYTGTHHWTLYKLMINKFLTGRNEFFGLENLILDPNINALTTLEPEL